MGNINGWKIVQDGYFEKILESKKGSLLVLRRDRLNWALWSGEHNAHRYYGIEDVAKFVKKFTKAHPNG